MKLNKTLLALPLIALLSMPSCTMLGDAQRDLNQMTVAQYDGLKTKVQALTAITSSRVAKDWDATKRQKATTLIANAKEMIDSNQLSDLGATDLIRTLADKYGEKMGLDEQARRDIKDAALLVDVLVGPINLGIDGKLGEREQGLLLALLNGLAIGIR